MNNSKEIFNELMDISPLLAGLEKLNVFQVPAGYFDNLDQQIASFAIANTRDLFSTKINVQQVPEGYFESLSTNILAKIKNLYPETADEELSHLSPVLHSLKDENVFKIPGGYFESLSGEVLKKLKPATGKVVVMKQRNSWMKIAAAAIVTGIIAAGSLQIFNTSSNVGNDKPIVIASVVTPDYVKESFQFKTEAQIDDGIAKLSDDDIMKYLEKNGNLMDDDLLLKNTDESELPAQTEYLYDANTLNSYLDKINGKEDDQLKN